MDYKLMCFNGQVMCSFVCSERYSGDGLKVTFYDREWNRLPFTRHYPAANLDIKKPEQYEKMVQLAETLSEEIPFVRTDFYEIAGRVYFGELTMYPGSGMEDFEPQKWDTTLGEWLKLPESVGGGYMLSGNMVCLWVHPEIMAESPGGIADYKVWCFNGKPRYIQYITGRDTGNTEEAFYDLEWNKQSFSHHNPLSHQSKEKPKCLSELINLAEVLARGRKFLRTDFYILKDDSIRFGELTFFPMSGLERWKPDNYERVFGDLLDIQENDKSY